MTNANRSVRPLATIALYLPANQCWQTFCDTDGDPAHMFPVSVDGQRLFFSTDDLRAAAKAAGLVALQDGRGRFALVVPE